MNRLLATLATLLLLSSTAFSQPGTDNNLTAINTVDPQAGARISFTYEVAAKIAMDLVTGDAAKAELAEYKENELFMLEREQFHLGVIESMKIKEVTYKADGDKYEQSNIVLNRYNRALTDANHKLSTKVNILGVGLAITTISLVVVALK